MKVKRRTMYYVTKNKPPMVSLIQQSYIAFPTRMTRCYYWKMKNESENLNQNLWGRGAW